jgi:hypothetical protein
MLYVGMINRILNPGLSVEEREGYMTVLREAQSVASEIVREDAAFCRGISDDGAEARRVHQVAGFAVSCLVRSLHTEEVRCGGTAGSVPRETLCPPHLE